MTLFALRLHSAKFTDPGPRGDGPRGESTLGTTSSAGGAAAAATTDADTPPLETLRTVLKGLASEEAGERRVHEVPFGRGDQPPPPPRLQGRTRTW